MKISEILFGYFILILLIIMASFSIWAFNAGVFIKDQTQKIDHASTAGNIKGLSIVVLVITILAFIGLSFYISPHGETVKKKLEEEHVP
jgi:uncharacterized BrkB/YihY/UPF0761 family membrane protein